MHIPNFGPCPVNKIQFNTLLRPKVRHSRAKMAINQSTHKMQSNGTTLLTDTNLTTTDHSPLNRKSGKLRAVHHRNILHANHNCNCQRVASELFQQVNNRSQLRDNSFILQLRKLLQISFFRFAQHTQRLNNPARKIITHAYVDEHNNPLLPAALTSLLVPAHC